MFRFLNRFFGGGDDFGGENSQLINSEFSKWSHLVDNSFWDLFEVFKSYNIKLYKLTQQGNNILVLVYLDDPSNTCFIGGDYLLQVNQGVGGNHNEMQTIYRLDVDVYSKVWSKIYDGKLGGYKQFLNEIFADKIKVYLLEKNF